MTMVDAATWIDKLEITELITRYAALNDAGDWEAVAALYVREGRMNRPTAPLQFVEGREAILAAFKSRPPRVSRHLVSNVLVTLESALAARAVSRILLFTGAAADDGGLPVPSPGGPLLGTYHDVLTKTPDGWRFVERCGALEFRSTP